MIAVLVPLYFEAKPLIEMMHLKQEKVLKRYSCFQNEERKILLVISGTGKIKAAAAAGALLERFQPEHLVIAGSCAGLKGQESGCTYLVHKVTDIETGRSYYPDLLVRSSLPEASLLSGSLVLGRNGGRDIPSPYDPAAYLEQEELKEYSLYDMETSAFCDTALRCLGPHQFHVLRFVSDLGEEVNKTVFANTCRKGMRPVSEYISALSATSMEKIIPYDTDAETEQLFCCSVTMARQLNQIIRYSISASIDWKEILDDMQKEGILPCLSREEGKKALNEFERRVIS